MTKRVRQRLAAHPMLADAALAASIYLVLALGVSTDAESEAAWWVGWLCNLAPTVPLVWRRHAPAAALVLSCVGTVLVVATVGPMGAEAATLVAVATVVAREQRARTAAALTVGAGVVVVVVSVLVEPQHPLSTLLPGMLAYLAAVAVGVAGRSRRAEVAAVAERGAREADLAVAAERARIAREVHDVVSHNVSVMVALAAGIEETVDRDPGRAGEAARLLAATGREALGELRGLLGVLHADGVAAGAAPSPQPGAADLPDLVARARAAGLDAELLVRGDVAAAPPLVQLTVFRLVQEAITNVLRHASGATRVEVRVDRGRGSTSVEVVDDGRASGTLGAGRGLQGMRERSALHGATLEAGPRSEKLGWRVGVVLPDGSRR